MSIAACHRLIGLLVIKIHFTLHPRNVPDSPFWFSAMPSILLLATRKKDGAFAEHPRGVPWLCAYNAASSQLNCAPGTLAQRGYPPHSVEEAWRPYDAACEA